jgi:hypothetical protein
MGRAHGACEVRSRREEEAMRDIGDDEQLASAGTALGTRLMPLLG